MAQVGRYVRPRITAPLDTQTPRYKWLVAGVIVLACATQIFSGTSLNIAIPRLMAAFGADLAETQWVATGFLIARTLVIPLLGWLSSLVGNRALFVIAMAGFTLTSIGCGLSTSLPMLIGFRVLQGLVTGPMEGLTAVILVQVFPPRQRGLALGLRTIGWASGELLFYTLGGYLFEHISWRMLFFLGIPSGVASIALGLMVLPKHRPERHPNVDYPGLLLLGGFLVPLLLVISFGRNSETAFFTLLALGLSACLGGCLFVARELSAASPAVNLRLFRHPAFCLLCSCGFFNSVGLFGALFMVPIFMQQVIGLTPMQAGLILLPALPFSILSGLLTGRLSDRFPPPLVALAGLLALTVVSQAFASLTALASVALLVGYMILYRAFMDTVGIPTTSLTVEMLPPEQVPMGQGLLGVTRSIGASFGVTMTSVFFERRHAWRQQQIYDHYDSASPAHAEPLQNASLSLHGAGVEHTAIEQEALETIRHHLDGEAIAMSFQESFFFICVCFLLAMIPMLFLLGRRSTSNAPG